MTEETKDIPDPVNIEPGESFEVGYGNGKSATVVSLSLRKQKEVSKLVKQLIEIESKGDALEATDSFDLAEQALRVCMPDLTDEFLDTIDAFNAIEIASNTLGKQRLSNEQKKTSG